MTGLRILIVEDELDHLALLNYILTIEDALVIATCSMAEATNLSKVQPIDIMLVDIKTIKKYAFIQRTKIVDVQLPKKIPKIGMVECVRDLDSRIVKESGCCTYFSKPFDADEIIRAILSHIEQSRFCKQFEIITTIGLA